MDERGYKIIAETFRSIFLCVAFCGTYLACHGQDSLMTARNSIRYLFDPANPVQGRSTLSLYQLQKVTSVGVEFKNENGSFRRPQEPLDQRLFSFHAAGVEHAKGLIVFGKFQYSVHQDEGQQWRNTAQPADEQPFIWADASAGTWDRNHFDAEMKLVTVRPNHRLQAGIELGYKGGSGDRRNTPKPLYRFHQLTFRPSIIYNGEASSISATLHYGQNSEDNEMGYFVYDSPLLYRLRGYGTFSRSPFVSGSRLLNATTIGGVFEYVKGDLAGSYLQAIASYNKTDGTIEEGIAVTTPAGDWNTDKMAAKFCWSAMRYPSHWLTTIDFSMSRVTGIDPVFQAINYYLNQFSITPAIRYAKGERWYADIHGEYSHRHQEDIVAVTTANIKRASIGLTYSSWFSLSDRVEVFACPGLDYSKALDSDLQIFSPTDISNALVRPDFIVLSQSYTQASIQAGADVKYEHNTIRFAVSLARLQSSEFSRSKVSASLNYIIQ